MEMDNIIDVDYDSGLASSAGDNHSSDDSDPDSTLNPTPQQKFCDSQSEKIASIKKGNSLPKQWSLRHKFSTSTRSRDSHLETLLDHDTTVCAKSLVSTKINEQTEHVIKQRIVYRLFFNIIVTPPERYKAIQMWKDVDDLPQTVYEKPTKCLAEFYAREFMDQQAEDRKGADVSTTVEREAGKI